MKPTDQPRAKILQIRLTPSEKAGIAQAAALAGMSLSSWVRERLRLAAIRDFESIDPLKGQAMSFVSRELDRISARLRHPDIPADEYEKLYAAQQALAWALEPEGFRSPYDAISGTLAGSEDCPEHAP